ncbi:hypothetical protein M758_2G051300 [Ceratodon purpureus]|nr:hypothetical protein M758_2G051300 [Ceratodon purpureus]
MRLFQIFWRIERSSTSVCAGRLAHLANDSTQGSGLVVLLMRASRGFTHEDKELVSAGWLSMIRSLTSGSIGRLETQPCSHLCAELIKILRICFIIVYGE